MEQEDYTCPFRLHITSVGLWRGVKFFLIFIFVLYNGYVSYSVCQRENPVSEQCEPEESVYQEGVILEYEGGWTADIQQFFSKDKFQICAINCCPEGESLDSFYNAKCTATTSLGGLMPWGIFWMRLTVPVINRTMCNRNNMNDVKYEVLDGRLVSQYKAVLTKDLYYIDICDYCVQKMHGQSFIFKMERYNINNLEMSTLLLSVVILWIIVILLFTTSLLVVTISLVRKWHTRTLRDKHVMNYLAAEALLYLSSAISIIIQRKLQLVIIQFSLLAKSSWISVMCLDLWLNSRRPLQQRTPQQSSNNWVQYTLYSILGWGVPTFFCVVTTGVGVEPFVSDSCPIPRLTRDACFFNRDRTAQLFLHIPADVMMQLDVLMIVSLLFNIAKHLFQAADVSSEPIQRYAQSTKKSRVYCWIVIYLMSLHWFSMLLLKHNRAIMDTFGVTEIAMLLSLLSFLDFMVLFYLRN